MVQKRMRSGLVRWVVRYRDPAGKERSRTFDTKREAAAWESERERERRRGEWLDPDDENTTVGPSRKSGSAEQRALTPFGAVWL